MFRERPSLILIKSCLLVIAGVFLSLALFSRKFSAGQQGSSLLAPTPGYKVPLKCPMVTPSGVSTVYLELAGFARTSNVWQWLKSLRLYWRDITVVGDDGSLSVFATRFTNLYSHFVHRLILLSKNFVRVLKISVIESDIQALPRIDFGAPMCRHFRIVRNWN